MSRKTMIAVSDQLRVEAIGLDACQKALREWTADPDALCELYIRHLDFCMEHNYPSGDVLKSRFDGVRQRHGIYVDERIDCRGARQVVCNGACTGRIRYDGYGVGTLYVRHQSDVEVNVADFAIVVIRVYDQARVRVKNAGVGRVAVLQYGGEVSTGGEVVCSDLREGAR